MSRRVQGGIGMGVDLLLSERNVSDSWCGSLLHLRIKGLIFCIPTECCWRLWDFLHSFHMVHVTEAGVGRQTLLRSMFWINIFWRNVIFFVVVEKAVEEALQEEARRCKQVTVEAAGSACRRVPLQRCSAAFLPRGGAGGSCGNAAASRSACPALSWAGSLEQASRQQRHHLTQTKEHFSPLLWLSLSILLILTVSV